MYRDLSLPVSLGWSYLEVSRCGVVREAFYLDGAGCPASEVCLFSIRRGGGSPSVRARVYGSRVAAVSPWLASAIPESC
ncbi:hypothetical protein YC2023_122756 [Brassica napus]